MRVIVFLAFYSALSVAKSIIRNPGKGSIFESPTLDFVLKFKDNECGSHQTGCSGDPGKRDFSRDIARTPRSLFESMIKWYHASGQEPRSADSGKYVDVVVDDHTE